MRKIQYTFNPFVDISCLTTRYSFFFLLLSLSLYHYLCISFILLLSLTHSLTHSLSLSLSHTLSPPFPPSLSHFPLSIDLPRYLLLNTAISSTWGFPQPCPDGCACDCYDCRKEECACAIPSGMEFRLLSYLTLSVLFCFVLLTG